MYGIRKHVALIESYENVIEENNQFIILIGNAPEYLKKMIRNFVFEKKHVIEYSKEREIIVE